MRCLFLITLSLLCLNIGAQQSYTEQLQKARQGKGRVTLHQTDEITRLVNSEGTVAKGKQPTVANNVTQQDTLAADTQDPAQASNPTGQRVSMSGYRIQIYSGGNSRQSKQQAESAATRARIAMPDESVYTNFISPRWVCRMGDYRSYEEAYQVLHTLKENSGFGDAVIVKSKIQVYID